MSRPRIKVYQRVRSTNPVTNIFDHRIGGAPTIRTNSRELIREMVTTCGSNITVLRTQF